MRKTLLFQTLILLFTFNIHAAMASGYIFINSDPIGARVFVNNVDRKQTTPCIIRSINPKIPPKIRIRKEGYKDYVLKVSDFKSGSVRISLTPVSFDLYFPQKTRFRIGSTQTKGPLSLNNMQAGNYSFNIVDDKIVISRYTNFTPAEVGVGVALGLSLAWMIISIVLSEDFYQNWVKYNKIDPNSNEAYHFKELDSSFQAVKFSAIGLTGAFTLALSSLIITDVLLRQRAKKQKYDIVSKPSSDEVFFETSKLYLGQGEIEKSIRILKLFLSVYPDSELIPSVYYQLGQNYFILQEYDTALEYWITFINDYPLADYYDYVIKNIADIYYQRSEYKTARQWLDRILFTTDASNAEEILSFKARLNSKLYYDTGNDDYYFSAESNFLNLITNFTTSARLDSYFSQLQKLYSSNNDADKLSDLKERANSLSIEDEALKAIILSLFE